jgi:hypothetical protein
VTPDPRSTGRTIGVLFLLHLVGAYVLTAVLLRPVFQAPGFLENAAAEPWRLPATMLLGLALAALTIAIALVARPVFRQHGEGLALAYVLVVAVGLALTAAENVGLFAMQRVSDAYAERVAAVQTVAPAVRPASPALTEPPANATPGGNVADVTASLAGARLVAASIRNGAHFTGVFVAGASIFLFYLILYRARLVPRLLAGGAALAALLQMYAVGRPFFGGLTNFSLLMPIAVMHLAGILWLVVRGFAPRASEP